MPWETRRCVMELTKSRERIAGEALSGKGKRLRGPRGSLSGAGAEGRPKQEIASRQNSLSFLHRDPPLPPRHRHFFVDSLRSLATPNSLPTSPTTHGRVQQA